MAGPSRDLLGVRPSRDPQRHRRVAKVVDAQTAEQVAGCIAKYATKPPRASALAWTGSRAADEGADWLRVDVWTTNEHLQHYYLKQGFTYVRTVVLPHNPSGAVFQRPARRIPTPHLQEVESLTG
jgi:hypothetical protein